MMTPRSPDGAVPGGIRGFAGRVKTWIPLRFIQATWMGVGLLAAEAAWAANAPAAPGVDAGALGRLIIGLGVVVAAIIALAWLLKRMGGVGGGTGGQLRVVGGLQVGHRERVVLIQVGEKQLLLGVAPGRVQTLHVLDQPLEGVGQPPSGAGHRAGDASFAEKLRQLMQQQREKQ